MRPHLSKGNTLSYAHAGKVTPEGNTGGLIPTFGKIPKVGGFIALTHHVRITGHGKHSELGTESQKANTRIAVASPQ